MSRRHLIHVGEALRYIDEEFVRLKEHRGYGFCGVLQTGVKNIREVSFNIFRHHLYVYQFCEVESCEKIEAKDENKDTAEMNDELVFHFERRPANLLS